MAHDLGVELESKVLSVFVNFLEFLLTLGWSLILHADTVKSVLDCILLLVV